MHALPIVNSIFVIFYIAAVITLIIYMIRLFRRLVMGVERIADSLENSAKNKPQAQQIESPTP